MKLLISLNMGAGTREGVFLPVNGESIRPARPSSADRCGWKSLISTDRVVDTSWRLTWKTFVGVVLIARVIAELALRYFEGANTAKHTVLLERWKWGGYEQQDRRIFGHQYGLECARHERSMHTIYYTAHRIWPNILRTGNEGCSPCIQVWTSSVPEAWGCFHRWGLGLLHAWQHCKRSRLIICIQWRWAELATMTIRTVSWSI